MGFTSFIKEVIEEEKNKTPEQRQQEKEEKEKKKLDKIYDKYSDYLLDDEKIIFNTSNSKGVYLFFANRIFIHDYTTSKVTKQEYHSIPYKNIKRFTIETAGAMDLDTDIKLFLGGGQNESITLKVPVKSTKTINEIILNKIL